VSRSNSARAPRTRATRADTRFDREYFRRYYYSPSTRVTERAEMQVRANLIAAVLAHAQLPVRRLLDAGCGIGLLQPAFARSLPKARYSGLEASDYLCQRYGWIKGSVASFRPPTPADLVVCYDVLQYLDDRQASLALSNLARLTRCALYFSALTRADWRNNCDRSRTDSEVYLRSGDWYWRRLQKNFRYLACGVWVLKSVSVIRWELEAAPKALRPR
jgi:predicted TPR repeat methyltransferase